MNTDKDDLLESFQEFFYIIKDCNVNWALIGTFRLFIEGISIKPSDIDILTDKSGAFQIEKIFADFFTKEVIYSTNDTLRSFFGQMKFMNVNYDIVGEMQNKVNGRWEEIPSLNNKIVVKHAIGEIPVLDLDHEFSTSILIKDFFKAKLIRNKIIVDTSPNTAESGHATVRLNIEDELNKRVANLTRKA